MKKVLFCSYSMDIGGIETSLINLFNNFDYEKYEVTLVLEKKEGLLLDKINKNVKIEEYKVCESKFLPYRKIKNYLNRKKWIKNNKNKYDFSACYATYSLACNFMGYYGSENNCFFIHGDYTNIYHTKEELDDFFNRRRINDFKKVVFVSNESKDALIDYYSKLKETGVVINNLINNKEILEKSNEKIDFQKDNNKPLFTFVGRFDEASKRITKMINAFDGLNANLVLVGDGPDKDTYIEMSKDKENIKIVGPKKNPYPYIKQTDYLILTSDYEGFPVVYNEALVLNKKIVTTINVSDEIIKSISDYGYIISKKPSEMKEQLKNIIENDNKECKWIDFEIVNKNRIGLIEDLIEGR